MVTYNDAWFMNESLAFYTSTNTFTNPTFDAQFSLGEEQEGAVLQEEVGRGLQGECSIESHDEQEGRRQDVSLMSRCSNICDNLLFSIKSKMFVLELNFKRRLRNIRKYSVKNLPWLFNQRSLANGTQRDYLFSTTTHKIEPVLQYQNRQQQQQQVSNRQNGIQKNYDKFWKDIIPDSRKSLDLQHGKILSRLEQAVQAKRNNQGKLGDNNHFFPSKNPLNSQNATAGGSLSTTEVNKQTGKPLASDFSKLERRLKWNTLRSYNVKAQNGNALKLRGNSETESKKLCIVCYGNHPDIVTLPCKHNHICSDCFIELIYRAVKQTQFPLKCVLCRQRIERIRCSKRLLLKVIEKNRVSS